MNAIKYDFQSTYMPYNTIYILLRYNSSLLICEIKLFVFDVFFLYRKK